MKVCQVRRDVPAESGICGNSGSVTLTVRCERYGHEEIFECCADHELKIRDPRSPVMWCCNECVDRNQELVLVRVIG
jgi:hypothetical protein